MPQRTHIHAINRLDPERDHVRIGQLTALHEFPRDTTRALAGPVAVNLRTRGRLVRLLPERTVPHRRTRNARPTYPRRHHIEGLGPPPFSRAPEE